MRGCPTNQRLPVRNLHAWKSYLARLIPVRILKLRPPVNPAPEYSACLILRILLFVFCLCFLAFSYAVLVLILPTFVQRSSSGSYPAMDTSPPAPTAGLAQYYYNLGFEHGRAQYGQYGSNSTYVNCYPTFSTSSNSTSMYGSGPTHASQSPASTGNTIDPAQITASHTKKAEFGLDSNRNGDLYCLHLGCEYRTKRQYELARHLKTHLTSYDSDQKYDCPETGCGRKGEHGFHRKDHLREHLRKVHAKDLPENSKEGGRIRHKWKRDD